MPERLSDKQLDDVLDKDSEDGDYEEDDDYTDGNFDPVSPLSNNQPAKL